MYFEFVCGWCDEDCIVWGERTGFWGTRFVVDDFECWCCGGINVPPDGPWTPAE